MLATGEIRLLRDRRIAHRGVAGWYVERQLPGHLGIGLVDAWEHAPRVDRLELCDDIFRARGRLIECPGRLDRRVGARVVDREDDRPDLERRRAANLEQLLASRCDGERLVSRARLR